MPLLAADSTATDRGAAVLVAALRKLRLDQHVDAEDQVKDWGRTLSSGEIARLYLARVIARQPDVLIAARLTRRRGGWMVGSVGWGQGCRGGSGTNYAMLDRLNFVRVRFRLSQSRTYS